MEIVKQRQRHVQGGDTLLAEAALKLCAAKVAKSHRWALPSGFSPPPCAPPCSTTGYCCLRRRPTDVGPLPPRCGAERHGQAAPDRHHGVVVQVGLAHASAAAAPTRSLATHPCLPPVTSTVLGSDRVNRVKAMPMHQKLLLIALLTVEAHLKPSTYGKVADAYRRLCTSHEIPPLSSELFGTADHLCCSGFAAMEGTKRVGFEPRDAKVVLGPPLLPLGAASACPDPTRPCHGRWNADSAVASPQRAAGRTGRSPRPKAHAAGASTPLQC